MGKVTGFKEHERVVEPYRPAKERVIDFKEIYTDHDESLLNTQASRCMNCGVPFCQSGEGCPVYNLIPEWNDLVYNEKWEEAFKKSIECLPKELEPYKGTMQSLEKIFFPVQCYPTKVNSLNLLKSPVYEGKLIGVKAIFGVQGISWVKGAWQAPPGQPLYELADLMSSNDGAEGLLNS